VRAGRLNYLGGRPRRPNILSEDHVGVNHTDGPRCFD
jgi:hypothetical protein